jgi:hypothetical protein
MPPTCEVVHGQTLIKWSAAVHASRAFKCTHGASGSCACTFGHPTHTPGLCKQFEHSDGSLHQIGGDCTSDAGANTASPTAAPSASAQASAQAFSNGASSLLVGQKVMYVTSGGTDNFMQSPNGKYQLIMDTNCDMVVKCRNTVTGERTPVASWTGTASQSSGCSNGYFTLQTDNNFVAYKDASKEATQDVVLWHADSYAEGPTNEHAADAAAHLDLQDDGNLVLYKSDGTATNLWSCCSDSLQECKTTPFYMDTPTLFSGQTLPAGDANDKQWMQSLNGKYQLKLDKASGALQIFCRNPSTGKRCSKVTWENVPVKEIPGLCDTASPLITTEAECRTASINIGKPFAQALTDSIWQKGCLVHGGKVYFNPPSNCPGPLGCQKPTDNYLCHDKSPNSKMDLQLSDNNLVVYKSDGSTHTWAAFESDMPGPDAGAYLYLKDDGNLVLYSGNGNAKWASNTVDTCSDTDVTTNC